MDSFVRRSDDELATLGWFVVLGFDESGKGGGKDEQSR